MARKDNCLSLSKEDLEYMEKYAPFTPLKVFAMKFGCPLSTLEKYIVENEDASAVWQEGKAKAHEIGADNLYEFLKYNGDDIEEKKLKKDMLKFFLSHKVWREDKRVKLTDNDIKEITNSKDIDVAIATLTSKLLKCESMDKHDAIELIKLLSNVKISEDFNKDDNVLRDYTTPNERFQIENILKAAKHRKEQEKQGKSFN